VFYLFLGNPDHSLFYLSGEGEKGSLLSLWLAKGACGRDGGGFPFFPEGRGGAVSSIFSWKEKEGGREGKAASPLSSVGGGGREKGGHLKAQV